MHCTACGQANADDARFCGQCGQSLAAACAGCGAPLAPMQRFCTQCGRAAAGAPAAEDTAGEAFADRRYDADGSLAPRRDADAVIHDPETAAAQLVAIVDTGKVFARDGSVVAIDAQTICVHGDRADAAAFARTLRARLDACGVVVRAVRGAA